MRKKTIRVLSEENNVYILFYIAIGILCITLLATGQIFHPATIVGNSMEPTYKDGDIVSTSVFHPKTDTVAVDDVIIFDDEVYGKKLIKRVVGVEGDTIQIVGGVLYRNGIAVRDDFPKIKDAGIASKPLKIAKNKVFCLGDNRNNSTDSREFGEISYGKIDFIVNRILLKNEKEREK